MCDEQVFIAVCDGSVIVANVILTAVIVNVVAIDQLNCNVRVA